MGESLKNYIYPRIVSSDHPKASANILVAKLYHRAEELLPVISEVSLPLHMATL